MFGYNCSWLYKNSFAGFTGSKISLFLDNAPDKSALEAS
jgi:hypothetical protein